MKYYPNIDKIYFYVKDLDEQKYNFFNCFRRKLNISPSSITQSYYAGLKNRL